MAQYNVSHNARTARIRDLVGQMPGFALAGNAYSGIGVPDCVRSGTEAVGKILGDPSNREGLTRLTDMLPGFAMTPHIVCSDFE
jgi:oxygen-dependent protoporphyrinogen oxidase